MKYYEVEERQQLTLKDYVSIKYHCKDDFKEFYRQTEGQCPPSSIFSSVNKPICFHCVECKQKFFNDIRKLKNKYKYNKKEFKNEDLEGENE